MKEYVCSVCGYIYDEAIGIPEEGIAPGTKFADLDDDWVCPICGATKEEFELEKATVEVENHHSVIEASSDMEEMTPLEISALCANLARGCEKQYKPEESALFTELSAFFKKKVAPEKTANVSRLLELIENDLNTGFPKANLAANEVGDRGALRALVWSEKVTRILKSLLTRYQKNGEAMLDNTGVYVCTICGFIYVGDKLPEVCPVCKVPNWKFEEVKGGRVHE